MTWSRWRDQITLAGGQVKGIESGVTSLILEEGMTEVDEAV